VGEEHGCGGLRGNGRCIKFVSSSVLSSLTDVQPRFVSKLYIPDYLAVNCARDTVLKLEVHLRNGVFREYRGIRDITCESDISKTIQNTVYILQLAPSNPQITLGSELKVRANIRIAADSTMLRMVNLFIALSFGVHLEQLEHLIGLTWPRPFLLRPL
jgi:hypothetical protein